MSTAGMIRAVQDLALSEDANTAVVAVYGGLVRTMAHLLGGSDTAVDGLPDDAVLAAARREVPETTVAWMGDWLIANWEWVTIAAVVLEALDEVAADPFPHRSLLQRLRDWWQLRKIR